MCASRGRRSPLVGALFALRASLVLSLLSSVGCTYAHLAGPAIDSASAVAIRVSPRPYKGRIPPGWPATLAVVVTDRQGREFSTADGSLDWRRVSLQAKGAPYDPQTRSVTLPRTGGKGLVQLTARFKGRADLQAREVLERDDTFWRQPRSAAEVAISVEQRDPGFLLPGTVAGVAVDVKDKMGRWYSTRVKRGAKLRSFDTAPLLPGLVQIGGLGVEVIDKAQAIRALKTRDGRRVRSYRVAARYRGGAVWLSHPIQADWARVDGPAPESIRSIRMKWRPALGSRTLVPPGTSATLVVEAEDQEGRVFATDSATYPLPWRSLEVETERVAHDARGGFVFGPGAPADSVGKRYAIRVRLKGSNLRLTRALEPDFAGLLTAHISRDRRLDLSGSPGTTGSSGAHGEQGDEGDYGEGELGTGGPGGNGEDGQDGESGGDGSAGPAVTIVACTVHSLDRRHRYVLWETSSNGSRRVWRLTPWPESAITVVAAGGNGGHGGDGGQGGDGGAGGGGHNTGNGGDGGSGGSGGQGGSGGRGGRIALLVDGPATAARFALHAPGGDPGSGGDSGRGGAGGSAGSVAESVARLALQVFSKKKRNLPEPTRGDAGSAGRPGQRGEAGQHGPAGRTGVAQSSGAVRQMIRRLPPALRAILVFPALGKGKGPASPASDAEQKLCSGRCGRHLRGCLLGSQPACRERQACVTRERAARRCR